MNNNEIREKIFGLIELTRPAEWSKTFGNMVIAALLAKKMLFEDWLTFIIAFITAGPLLWGGLYTLNDWTDYKNDKLHKIKKDRPIPSGKVKPTEALFFALTLITMSFFISYFHLKNNVLFTICLTAMLINQTLYTMYPFNLKKVVVLDLISGSLINPVFRFFAGWVIFKQDFNAPLPIIIFVVGLQFSGYLLYRLSSKEHEQKLGYKSSVVILSENSIKLTSYIVTSISGLSFVYACIIGILPLKFLLLVILSLLAFPLYYDALVNPTKMNLKKVYKLTYLHYILFIFGFILLSYF